MDLSSCDLCDNPAYVRETMLRGRVVKVRRLCRAHGLALWRDAVIPATEDLAKRSQNRSVKNAVTIPATDDRPHRKTR